MQRYRLLGYESRRQSGYAYIAAFSEGGVLGLVLGGVLGGVLA